MSKKREILEKSKEATDKVEKYLMYKLEYVVAFAVCAVVWLISMTSGFEALENKYYDLYLKLSPDVKVDKNITMISIDDMAVEQIGTYPWSRDIIGDMLLRLREFGAKSITFDIEFLDASALGINPKYVSETLPKEYGTMQGEVLQTFNEFAGAVEARAVSASNAADIGQQMTDYLSPVMDDLYSSITTNIFRNNDEYFAKTLKFFGNAYLTINSSEVNTLDEAQKAIDYAYRNFLFDNVEDPKGYIKKENEEVRKVQFRRYGIGPAILLLQEKIQGGGFPNVILDDDGVHRRFELLAEYNGKYVAQLVFEPLLKELQPEKIIRKKYELILKNAYLPENHGKGERKDLRIPLDANGRCLVHWLKTSFEDSFRNESAYFLRQIDEIEALLIDHIKAITSLELRTSRGYLQYRNMGESLLAMYSEIEQMKEDLLEGVSEDFDGYFNLRKSFYHDIGEFITGGFDTEIYDTLDMIREANEDPELYRDIQDSIENYFSVFAEDYKTFNDEYERLTGIYNKAFCIIGHNAAGTTDLGVTPFYPNYPNVGTHANLYNTLVNRSFITPFPYIVTIALMLFTCIMFGILFRRIEKLSTRLFSGIAIIVGAMLIMYGLFVMFRIYVQTLPILVALILEFISITVARFMLSEKDKTFLRKAFATYLSGDIIDEIVKDPEKLKLGGQEKELTAIFTDVRSFSTLSEKVTPTQLVSILNKYLTTMSDIVLEHKGTIDKFEGDAIIAFYGAPVDNPQHARMALLSAIRMKQAEIELNKVLVESGEAPNALLTRIGINSGPMVVGNMGTDAKMNYTIMGNDVNLAARLEGVNKVYGTWILASEASYNAAGEGFLGRRLDRVRVVGINTPVQLYNVMGLTEEMSQDTIDGVANFHEALDLYLEQNFEKATKYFNEVKKLIPDDPPSDVYLERCRKFAITGVPDGWDGVVNMTSK